MLLDLLVKRASRNPKTLCGLLDAASLLLKYPLDVLLLEFQKSQTRVEKRCSHLSVPVKVKII